jgi:4-hydroxy-3-methylbut-2-enyl diphosphate reductase
MKKFDIPPFYRSSFITEIKNFRRDRDSRKKDFHPTVLDFGPVKFLLARHFGFCYGVENAIEISYKAIAENPGQRIFLLSEMIHNPDVNRDLLSRGVRFIMHTSGEQIVPWEELKADDIVIVPAFGTTLEIQSKLSAIGIQSYLYDTTCPFVEKVWNKAAAIGQEHYTVVIHGKPSHEETRATFSHSKEAAPTVVVRDMAEAEKLAGVLQGQIDPQEFYDIFKDQHSVGFDVAKDLERIGVVNQTTMLAVETQAIADFLKHAMMTKFHLPEHEIGRHFADTRDTLCYATNDNQNAIYGLLHEKADLAIVAGGYNSSNTSHLYELCEKTLSTYYISSADRIISKDHIHHFDFHRKTEMTAENFLPSKMPVTIMLASGASCPDVIVENIILKILSFFENRKNLDDVMADFKQSYSIESLYD